MIYYILSLTLSYMISYNIYDTYCRKRGKHMKIITTATLKGGSGKTINTFNIAGILAESHRVLLIDVDPQCNLSNNCGIDVADPQLKTVRDIFDNLPENQPQPEQVIFKSPISDLPNLDIIPSSIMLFDTEMNMVNAASRENFLKYYIDDYKKYLENNYDYILIDTNPSMSIVNINAFYVADKIILTSDVSTNSINGAELFCSLWNRKRKQLRKEDNIAGLIIGNFDKRTNLGKNLIDYTNGATFSQDIILNTVVPSTVKLKNSEVEHQPVNLLYPKDEIRKVYDNIISELTEKGVL